MFENTKGVIADRRIEEVQKTKRKRTTSDLKKLYAENTRSNGRVSSFPASLVSSVELLLLQTQNTHGDIECQSIKCQN